MSNEVSEANKMNPEFKSKWIEALRSGKYEQGQGELRPTENTYCCLGVLCDIIDPNGWGEEDYNSFHYKDRIQYCQLPTQLKTELNMSDGIQNILVRKNDGGSNFEEIAQYIEENL